MAEGTAVHRVTDTLPPSSGTKSFPRYDCGWLHHFAQSIIRYASQTKFFLGVKKWQSEETKTGSKGGLSGTRTCT